jgi:hypothetical protein
MRALQSVPSWLLWLQDLHRLFLLTTTGVFIFRTENCIACIDTGMFRCQNYGSVAKLHSYSHARTALNIGTLPLFKHTKSIRMFWQLLRLAVGVYLLR